MASKNINKFLATILSLLFAYSQFDNKFVNAMKRISFNSVSPSDLQKIKYTFSSDNPTNEFMPYGATVSHNQLIEINDGKEKYHVRLIVLNAPCLLRDNPKIEDFKHIQKRVEPKNFDLMLKDGMNFVHAIANMTIDSYIEARKHGYLAEKYSKEAMEKATEICTQLANSDDYKPIVGTVKNFVSKYNLESTCDAAKTIVISYLIGSTGATTSSNVAKGIFWGAECATVVVGIVGCFFTPALLLDVPIAGLGFIAGLKFAQSDEEVKRLVEVSKIVNYTDVLFQFRDLIENRGEMVGRCNALVLAFDDMTDFESKKTIPFVHTKADAFKDYKNRGSICEAINIKGDSNILPLIKDYRNENGQTIFLFYKDVFRRIKNIETTDEAMFLKQFLRGNPRPQKPLSDEEEKAITTKSNCSIQ